MEEQFFCFDRYAVSFWNFHVELYLTCNKMHTILLKCSVNFPLGIQQIMHISHFRLLRKLFVPYPSQHASPAPKATSTLSSININWVLSVLEHHAIKSHTIFISAWPLCSPLCLMKTTHIVACGCSSFLCIAKRYPIGWIYHNLRIPLQLGIWIISTLGLLWTKLLLL